MIQRFSTKLDPYNGFVIYANSEKRFYPLGLISSNHERQASLVEIPIFIKKALVEIEDKRFYQHIGVDLKSILRSLCANYKAKKIVQGGSTITQQLVRNTTRKNSKTYTRKLIEILKAIHTESLYSKEQILNMYFENVYFGNNIYGLRAASLYYFSKEPYALNHSEQLIFLTILRGPNFYVKNVLQAELRFKLLNNLLFTKSQINLNRFRKNSKVKISLQHNFLNVFNSKCIPFISKNINIEKRIIETTIDYNLQEHIHNWIVGSKYPVSIVCIEKGKVIAADSSFGIAHVFDFKTNVGSTLKPFIYAYLRNKNVEHNQLIDTSNNNILGWNVRETVKVERRITLSDALFYSNNNAFINACLDTNLDDLYSFLSLILQKNKDEFLPSVILGATKSGITLFELASCYSDFFCNSSNSNIVNDCLDVLKKIAKNKLDITTKNIFLKSGTTNNNKERFAVLGHGDRVYAILRGDNPINDYSKEGNFMNSIKELINNKYWKSNIYSWNK